MPMLRKPPIGYLGAIYPIMNSESLREQAAAINDGSAWTVAALSVRRAGRKKPNG